MRALHLALTLDPLRTNGPDALDVRGIPEIRHITLREVQFVRDNAFHETITRRADDLFRCSAVDYENEPVVPADAVLVHAFFDIQFADSPQPRSLLLRLPSTIKVEQDADAPVIHRFLCERGFALSRSGEEARSA